MSKKSFTLCLGAALLLTQMPAAAFSGCADSPENPTLVLALLGAATVGLHRVLLMRRTARKAAAIAEPRRRP